MIPAFLNRTSDATSEVANAPVCEEAALAPAAEPPHFTVTMGFLADTRRAIRANWLGLPNDSRYSKITLVAGSCSQYCKKSLDETSARLPTLTKVEIPI